MRPLLTASLPAAFVLAGQTAPGSGTSTARARLLIACKEDAGPELPGIRAIYAFDLSSLERTPFPAFRLDRSVLDAPPRLFKPSALAARPRTGEVHVLAAAREIPSPDGALTAAVASPDAPYLQPEGLAFGAGGTPYVATEGRSGAAALLRFRERPTR